MSDMRVRVHPHVLAIDIGYSELVRGLGLGYRVSVRLSIGVRVGLRGYGLRV